MTLVYALLKTLGAMVYPVALVALMHVAYLFMVTSPGDAAIVAFRWTATVALFSVGGLFAALGLRRLVDSGRLQPVLDHAATAFFNRVRKWLLLQDEEAVVDCAHVQTVRGGGALILTDRRIVIVVASRPWGRPELVTECDRLAVKTVVERHAERSLAEKLRGDVFDGSIELELVGVGAPQRIRFSEPRSRARIATALSSQPRGRPARHGIRLIQYLPKRRALKRRYVESFVPDRRTPFLQAFLMSTIFPGFGQIRQGRARTGIPYAALFLVLIAAMVARGAHAGQEQGGALFAAPIVSMVVVWVVSIVELFMHRHIHPHG